MIIPVGVQVSDEPIIRQNEPISWVILRG